jgi:hypothetical protein
MSDAPPPRIRVTLPAGEAGPVPGRLVSWHQEAGDWWAEVLVRVPAGAVGKVDGEDYSAVPRDAAPVQYVLQTLRQDIPEQRALVLHVAGCWAAEGRLTPVDTADRARGMLRFDDTSACDICHPTP